MNKKALLMTLALLTTSAFADNCERPQNTFDSLYCAKKVFFALDDDLNKTYKALRKRLNKSEKKVLKRSQLAWIKERNDLCVNYDAIIVSCAVKMTRQRLHFLKDRLYECKSVGCIKDNLSDY